MSLLMRREHLLCVFKTGLLSSRNHEESSSWTWGKGCGLRKGEGVGFLGRCDVGVGGGDWKEG